VSTLTCNDVEASRLTWNNVEVSRLTWDDAEASRLTWDNVEMSKHDAHVHGTTSEMSKLTPRCLDRLTWSNAEMTWNNAKVSKLTCWNNARVSSKTHNWDDAEQSSLTWRCPYSPREDAKMSRHNAGPTWDTWDDAETFQTPTWDDAVQTHLASWCPPRPGRPRILVRPRTRRGPGDREPPSRPVNPSRPVLVSGGIRAVLCRITPFTSDVFGRFRTFRIMMSQTTAVFGETLSSR
jgi:hypothetical protein